jgi:4-carboxymuconolactone decarboxylase
MKIPAPYMKMKAEQPALMKAYEQFGDACSKAGPLDEKTVALVKLGISLAAGLEGASHSHARKALEAGCRAEELLHVAHLCAPTIGFPTMMRARGWVAETIKEQGE